MNVDEARDNFSRNLRKLMKERGYSFRGLSKKIGISGAGVFNYTSGREMPTIDHLIMLCDVLDTTPNELFGYNSRKLS